MTIDRDAILEGLRALPAPEVPRAVDERTRRLARRTFSARWPWASSLPRRGESAALVLFVLVHLCWAFQQAGFWPGR